MGVVGTKISVAKKKLKNKPPFSNPRSAPGLVLAIWLVCVETAGCNIVQSSGHQGRAQLVTTRPHVLVPLISRPMVSSQVDACKSPAIGKFSLVV